jgi:hypothetical protein
LTTDVPTVVAPFFQTMFMVPAPMMVFGAVAGPPRASGQADMPVLTALVNEPFVAAVVGVQLENVPVEVIVSFWVVLVSPGLTVAVPLEVLQVRSVEAAPAGADITKGAATMATDPPSNASRRSMLFLL